MLKLNTEQLKRHITQEFMRISDTFPENYYFKKNNDSSNEGVYIFSDEKGYYYIISE